MKPRAAWPVLAKKAQEKCEEARAALIKTRERVAQLQQSRKRMEILYDDYVVRSKEAEKRPHSMSETLNFRSFMQQLQALIARVDLDLMDAHHAVEVARLKVKTAEQKRIQMETLLEQDLKAVRDYHRKREQKEMDAAGITLYNLKH
ncbi:MAG: flagellar export protein FliJ [Limnohabitans sp.]